MKRALKYLFYSLIWIISGVLILVIAVALLIQTRPAKNLIANLATKYSTLFINRTLGIERVDGNFFSSLIISNISLTGGQDTIAGIDELNIRYNLWSVINNKTEIDHPQFNITVDGHAGIEGEDGNLVYGGDLNIPKSEIYLPAVLSMMNKMYVPEIPKPLLVEELEKMTDAKDSVVQVRLEPVPVDSSASDFAENLTGNLRIRIPKNMWIKNEDLRAEISGDLELRKNESFFELFGIIEIVRGQYDLLGKTFIIKEGSVSFQGGEEITPRLDIDALYTFRNPQRIEQILSAAISGTPEDLEINFTLDEEPVNEGDALSYILFGKSINELSMDEQENLGGEQGPLAGREAASLLSAQLTNFLGDKLNVNYLEIKSDGFFDNATIEVGRYITNDIFVSYEQHFGETDEINMAKYEVKLEYELFRFLFFVLNNSSDRSGFDVIVRFNVK